MGSWGLGHWIIVLIIVLIVFGTKRLTSGARDVGNAVNEFKKGMRGDDDKKPHQGPGDNASQGDGNSTGNTSQQNNDQSQH